MEIILEYNAPYDAASYPRRVQISTTSRRKPEIKVTVIIEEEVDEKSPSHLRQMDEKCIRNFNAKRNTLYCAWKDNIKIDINLRMWTGFECNCASQQCSVADNKNL
jgi:hypothetical protein